MEGRENWISAEGDFSRRAEKSAILPNYSGFLILENSSIIAFMSRVNFHFRPLISVFIDGNDVIVVLDVDGDGSGGVHGAHDSGRGCGPRGSSVPVRLCGAAQRQQHAGRGDDALAPHDDLHGGRRGGTQFLFSVLY